MSVDTMRFIDYYAGVPLCFLATLWLKITGLFTGRKDPNKKSERVAFLQLSEMGSAIIGDAALRWLRDQNVEIFYVIFARNVASLKMIGTVREENIFLIREDNMLTFAADILKYLVWCRSKKIDAIVDFELFSRFSSLLTAFSGARERVGFHAFHAEGLYRGTVLTRAVIYNPHIHIAKNFMALVRTLVSKELDIPFFKGEIKDSEIRPQKVQIASAALQQVKEAVQKQIDITDLSQIKLVIMNCAGGEFLPQRRWPQMHYAKLIQTVIDADPKVRVLLTGSPAEAQEVDPIRVLSSRDRCFNFAGKVKFSELTALYSLSRVMVSNDSGPAHFASLTDMPTFVFFGPETPALYGSLGNFTALYANLACSPCVSAFNHRKTPCRDNKCLQVISPDSVYQKISSYLS